ncbi:hypothetical protein T4D_8301 [Trichinella pseudospiralis]|uniref:Uncharacterized protein n=1 Tax=Trichinella pseudospiralis TaxID=6337 RepID=A0A0V1FAH9_TRIPS|nr:hypothetical protein T4D_8301 [Trichinella pseudospiralis]
MPVLFLIYGLMTCMFLEAEGRKLRLCARRCCLPSSDVWEAIIITYIFKNPKICVLDERTRVKVQMACGHDVIERWMFSSPIFHETTSVEFGVSEFTVAATVWRYFSENKDRKNYYFYRSCTNDYIPGCTQLDDVEN